MNGPITKSEFLERLADAAMEYRSSFAAVRLTASSNDMINLAVKAAEDSKLPAIATATDPITDAILEIGAVGKGPTHIQVMIYAERAWEHMLNDKQAYLTFKQLNP